MSLSFVINKVTWTHRVAFYVTKTLNWNWTCSSIKVHRINYFMFSRFREGSWRRVWHEYNIGWWLIWEVNVLQVIIVFIIVFIVLCPYFVDIYWLYGVFIIKNNSCTFFTLMHHFILVMKVCYRSNRPSTEVIVCLWKCLIRYQRRQHLVDVTEIFNLLNWEKKERLFKLGYIILLLFMCLFW